MSGFGYTGQVKDPIVRKALEQAYALINTQANQIAELQQTVLRLTGATLDIQERRLINLGDAHEAGDATNLRTVRTVVEALTEARLGGVSGTIDTTATPLLEVLNGLIVGAS